MVKRLVANEAAVKLLSLVDPTGAHTSCSRDLPSKRKHLKRGAESCAAIVGVTKHVDHVQPQQLRLLKVQMMMDDG